MARQVIKVGGKPYLVVRHEGHDPVEEAVIFRRIGGKWSNSCGTDELRSVRAALR